MTGWMIAAGVYGVMSAVAFIAYAIDKRWARLARRRIPEATLHAVELLGGWPGAFLAQRIVRHKNAKASYQVVFWLIVVLHLVVWSWLLMGAPGSH